MTPAAVVPRVAMATRRHVLEARTADGARLRLQSVRPLRGGEGAPSVLMVHGFAQNHRCFDAPGRSLAEHLAAKDLSPSEILRLAAEEVLFDLLEREQPHQPREHLAHHQASSRGRARRLPRHAT